MQHVTAMLRHWLAKNNIDCEGVRLVIEFPDRQTVYRAEQTIKREVSATMASYITGGTFGAIEQMNGLGLSLRVAPADEVANRREALALAIAHIDHMAAWITKQNAGYSFESLGEDLPGIRAALGKAP